MVTHFTKNVWFFGATASGQVESVQSIREHVDYGEVAIIIPIIVLMVGILINVLLGIYKKKWLFPFMLSLSGLFIISIIFLASKHNASEGILNYKIGAWPYPLGIEFSIDGFSLFVLSTLALITFLVILGSKNLVPYELPGKETPFYTLLLITLLGLSGIVMTQDLFNLYVFLEVSSIGGYALLSTGRKRGVISAYRYLIMGTLGASFYLLGVGFLYVDVGTLNMVDIAAQLNSGHFHPEILFLSTALIITGMGLKMALFPMHLWLPDAYSFSSSPAIAFIAPLMTKVSAYVLFRYVYFIVPSDFWNQQGVIFKKGLVFISCIGIAYGAFMAFSQKDLKRLLAYSSIGQVSYIGLGLGLNNPFALVAAFIHILSHALMKCNLFLLAGGLHQNYQTTRISHLTGLGKKMPVLNISLLAMTIGMIGLPPSLGFFSKVFLVRGSFSTLLMPLFIVFSSILTAMYFVKLVIPILFKTYEASEKNVITNPRGFEIWLRIPLLITTVLILTLGLFNQDIIEFYWGTEFYQSLINGLNKVEVGGI